MVDMVLATEMTRHFEHVSRFVSVINQPLQHDVDAEDVRSSFATFRVRRILYIIFPIVCLCALTLYPPTDCAAATDISGVSGRCQLSR